MGRNNNIFNKKKKSLKMQNACSVIQITEMRHAFANQKLSNADLFIQS